MVAPPRKELVVIDTSDFDELSETYRVIVMAEGKAQKEMESAKNDMELTGLKVELIVIHEAGGDSKKVGSSETDRKRAYEIARANSIVYTTAKDVYLSARVDYRYQQGMLKLFELRLKFQVAINSR